MEDLYQKGVEAFDGSNYETAIRCFQQVAKEGNNPEAEAYLPLCYFSLASDTAEAAAAQKDTQKLVYGQQYAVKMCDLAIRSALKFLHKYPNDRDNCNVAGMMISRSFSMQYALVATGLTTAYRLSGTTQTIERTSLNGVTLWEELLSEENYSFVSFTSYDFSQYHLFDDDERTKRIELNKKSILNNAVMVATILDCMDRGYDALLVRAVMAAEMADCENGDRSMVLAADWFMAMAMQVSCEVLDEAASDAWTKMNEVTFTEIVEYKNKYGALLRQMRRDGMQPNLLPFYQTPGEAPKVEDCVVYTTYQQENADTEKKAAAGDFFAAFLTVFAQATTQRVIPIVVFPGLFSLLFGGMLRDGGVNVFSVIWLILTLGLTFIRSVKDSYVTNGKRSTIMFMVIRFAIAIVFSLNFWLGLVSFIVLKFLSKRYQ